MGHSYKGQAVPFSGNPFAPLDGPPPVLSLGTFPVINWATVFPYGYDTLQMQYSFDGVTGWNDGSVSPSSTGSINQAAPYFYRAFFVKGSQRTASSNIVIF